MRVIARKGMSAATMQEIAQEAGVAKGTIYLYFRDRDELVERTLDTAITQLHARVDAALALELPFEEKLRGVVRAQMEFFRENAEFFRLYMTLRTPDGNPHHHRRQKRAWCSPQYQTRLRMFADVLAEAMRRGEVRKMDPYRLALFLTEATIAIILERLTEKEAPAEDEDIDMIVGIALDGIRKQKRSTH